MYKDKFKRLYLNELTLIPSCSDEAKTYQSIELYRATVKAAELKLGTKDIVFTKGVGDKILYGDVRLKDFCLKHRGNPGVELITSSLNRAMYSNSGETYYNSENVFVTLSATGERAFGLTAAYEHDVPSVGFCSEEGEKNVMAKITVSSDNRTDELKWPSLTKPCHFDDNDFQIWLQDHTPVELVETALPFGNKKIMLQDDHGKDLLKAHAKKLCKNKYVVGILCSLEWKRGFKDYIYDKTPEGLIDIVPLGTDRGYAMRVKTTGRNQKETDAIAEILKKKYGHR